MKMRDMKYFKIKMKKSNLMKNTYFDPVDESCYFSSVRFNLVVRHRTVYYM